MRVGVEHTRNSIAGGRVSARSTESAEHRHRTAGKAKLQCILYREAVLMWRQCPTPSFPARSLQTIFFRENRGTFALPYSTVCRL